MPPASLLAPVRTAKATLLPSSSKTKSGKAEEVVTGTVTFYERKGVGEMKVSLDLFTNGKDGERGLHIHEKDVDGDGDCDSTGPHFDEKAMRKDYDDYDHDNPQHHRDKAHKEGKGHGGFCSKERHVGDFGNILFRNGRCKATYKVNTSFHKMSLFGSPLSSETPPYSILNASVVVHQGVDNLDPSTTSGLSGPKAGCGTIRVEKEFTPAFALFLLLVPVAILLSTAPTNS